MKKIKLCSFVANYTHACIITSNFISNEFIDAKVIYINENSQKEKLEKIVNKYFRKLNKKIIYMEWLNEDIINDYANENIILVVNGSESFITKVNSFISFLKYNVLVINCYNVSELKSKVSDIVISHDYFLNTDGLKSINAC